MAPVLLMAMSGIINIAQSMLSASEQRLSVVSHNIANTGTSGFKAQMSFSEAMTISQSRNAQNSNQIRSTDFSQGKLSQTNSPLDFAISGEGFFQLKSSAGNFYSRGGQFEFVDGGRLRTPGGLFLQNENGNDVVLPTLSAKILQDGTILDNGLPVDRIGLFAPKNSDAMRNHGGTMFTAAERHMDIDRESVLRQGMIEASNVSSADQMVRMMSSIREAEIGSRLVQTYDTLIGQAISTFGQN